MSLRPTPGVLLYLGEPGQVSVVAPVSSRASYRILQEALERIKNIPVSGNLAFDPLGLRRVDWTTPPMDLSAAPNWGPPCLICVPAPRFGNP